MARQAGDAQAAILHLGRAARYLSRLQFQLRSVPWPQYERGLTLLEMVPRQRNEADRSRLLDGAQHAFEGYLTGRRTDPSLRADAHYRLATIAERRQRSEAARRHYELAARGGHPQARRWLASGGADE
jgi:hypothetical protein